MPKKRPATPQDIANLKRAVERVLQQFKKLNADEVVLKRLMNNLAAAGYKATIPKRYHF